jgi:molecular chaperone GrpE
MEPINNKDNQEEILRGSDIEDSVSVDDFIRELEEKEKDLQIDFDSVVELDEEEFEGDDVMALEPLFPVKTPDKAEPKPAPAVADAPAKETFDRIKADNAIAELNIKVANMEAARKELLLDSQRRIRDFEAFRKRIEREREETFANQISNLAFQMLPVLDNLDRALDFVENAPIEDREEIQPFFDGIIMVNQQIHEVFAGMGIEPILAVGKPFDPHLHEAVSLDETSDLPPNTISEEILRGYRVGDKVIRHSMVKVTKAAVPEPVLPTETLPEIELDAEQPETPADDIAAETVDTFEIVDGPITVADDKPSNDAADEMEFEIERFGVSGGDAEDGSK